MRGGGREVKQEEAGGRGGREKAVGTQVAICTHLQRKLHL